MNRVNIPALVVILLQALASIRAVQSQPAVHAKHSSPGQLAVNDERCCPLIVHPPDTPPKMSSVVAPYSGWRGQAAVITDWGNCTPSSTAFGYAVEWGDGSEPDWAMQEGLKAFKATHQFEHWNRGYLVTAHYCWVHPGAKPQWPFPPDQSCCTSYSRVVMASYDPYALT